MGTTVARTRRRGGRKIPTPTSFGSAPPLSASEFSAFRHGFFYSVRSFFQCCFLAVHRHGLITDIEHVPCSSTFYRCKILYFLSSSAQDRAYSPFIGCDLYSSRHPFYQYKAENLFYTGAKAETYCTFYK
jgi:hypothetical protein